MEGADVELGGAEWGGPVLTRVMHSTAKHGRYKVTGIGVIIILPQSALANSIGRSSGHAAAECVHTCLWRWRGIRLRRCDGRGSRCRRRWRCCCRTTLRTNQTERRVSNVCWNDGQTVVAGFCREIAVARLLSLEVPSGLASAEACSAQRLACYN